MVIILYRSQEIIYGQLVIGHWGHASLKPEYIKCTGLDITKMFIDGKTAHILEKAIYTVCPGSSDPPEKTF